ncbi:Endonuclease/exonuclease/phosphatase [Immersiella caudata]|uniref:Endonuclease/exonuclease/phosphatase n=1 Tax=Immersiella caudata TaxID=314043 RepID=A0AA39XER6_9PEZI|nr:Endonuclease/exonuclease/phosphatase [Immersiella caudata]
METHPNEISVVTLNCWGLKYISKLRRERLSEIGRQLAVANPQPQIVALQECWTQEDYKSIRRETRFILPYGKFYHSGAFGGGLAILSQWPIDESSMFRYPLNGRPTAFWRGDWFVGKGVAHAKIRYGPGPKHVVEVFNTHTHAPYESGPNDSYLCHRLAQAWEMSKLLRGAAERGHLVLALGDFNMIPLSLEHRIITAHSPVRDTWRVLRPDSSVGPADHPAEKARRRPIPTAKFNIQENGAASDGPYNTWRWSKEQQKLLGPGKPEVTVPPDTIDHRGKRLDYVFANSGDATALNGSWSVTRTAVGMMMRHPELGCSLSDHFAMEATLSFHPISPNASANNLSHLTPIQPPKILSSNMTAIPRADSEIITDSLRLTSKEEHPDPSDETDSRLETRTMSTHIPTYALQNGTFLHIPSQPSPRPSVDYTRSSPTSKDFTTHLSNTEDTSPAFPSSAYDEILAVVQKYDRRERSQMSWRGRHFFASVAVWVACLVGVWFNPHNYVSFILILVSGLWLVAGTIDGLLSLLFFKSELRALKELKWEVINAKASIGGVAPPQDEGDNDERPW